MSHPCGRGRGTIQIAGPSKVRDHRWGTALWYLQSTCSVTNLHGVPIIHARIQKDIFIPHLIVYEHNEDSGTRCDSSDTITNYLQVLRDSNERDGRRVAGSRVDEEQVCQEQTGHGRMSRRGSHGPESPKSPSRKILVRPTQLQGFITTPSMISLVTSIWTAWQLSWWNTRPTSCSTHCHWPSKRLTRWTPKTSQCHCEHNKALIIQTQHVFRNFHTKDSTNDISILTRGWEGWGVGGRGYFKLSRNTQKKLLERVWDVRLIQTSWIIDKDWQRENKSRSWESGRDTFIEKTTARCLSDKPHQK